jgi:hypothetical protein
VASNFTCVFEPPRVESLRAAFNRLKPALREFVQLKEREALRERQRILERPEDKLPPGYRAEFEREKFELFPEQAFRQAKTARRST